MRSTLDDKGGIITERGSDSVTVRLRIPAGVVTADQLRGIANIATRYHASVHLTVRQTVELSHVNPQDLTVLVSDLLENGTPLGSERAEVVNITACPGSDRCRFGLFDSIAFARVLDEKHFGREMPVKTRIAVSACPYSCMSERLSEVGITGVVRPYRKSGTCTGCDACAQYCKEGAISVRNGQLEMDMDKCILCGMCILSCPYGIIHADPPAYQISIGGRRGRYPAIGQHLVTVKSEESAFKVVGMVVDWIYRSAWEGSLLQDQIERIEPGRLRDRVIESLSPDEIETGY
ncbi:MAG TPA: 4Fe-4S binding protein [Methanospirillum sp.]|nr:4Fe-4S binding protein [Methanospirillum sp.]